MYELLYKLLTTKHPLSLDEICEGLTIPPIVVHVVLLTLIDNDVVSYKDGKYTILTLSHNLPQGMTAVGMMVERLTKGLTINTLIKLDKYLTIYNSDNKDSITFNYVEFQQHLSSDPHITVKPVIDGEATDLCLPGSHSTKIDEAITIFTAMYNSLDSDDWTLLFGSKSLSKYETKFSNN